MKDTDVCIIGAGILGVSLAFHLTQRGKRVTLLEREGSYARHASGKNAGMFRQLYRHPELTEWAVKSRLQWPESVKHEAFRQTGSLVVGRRSPGHHPELFRETEIVTAGGLLPAVFTETDGLLDPYTYVASLFSNIVRSGFRALFHETVISIDRPALGHWIVRCDSGAEIESPILVNAAGAWVNSFLEQADSIVAEPFARHLFVVSNFDSTFMPGGNVGFYWDETAEWYLRAWGENERLVSICDKHSADPAHFSPPDLSCALSEKLLEVIPETAPSLSIARGWHCFRTYTDDQLPVWGFDERGLFWLAAFGGFGMSTGFAAAQDAADLLTGRVTSSHEDFSPNRVANRGSVALRRMDERLHE